MFEARKQCLKPPNNGKTEKTMFGANLAQKRARPKVLPQSGIIVVYNPGEDKETFDAPEP
jgi:hypothetical protein